MPSRDYTISHSRSVSGSAIFGAFLVVLLVLPLRTWWAMLLFGIIHHDFISQVPAFGFWQTFFIAALINVLTSKVSGSSSD